MLLMLTPEHSVYRDVCGCSLVKTNPTVVADECVGRYAY